MRYLITLFYLLATLPAGATLNDVDKTQIWNKNLLMNGGFESGKARWTASGGTFAVTSSSPMIGLTHATWDSNAASQTLTTTAITIPAGMYGRNAVASCLITTPSGTETILLQAYDGTNILSSVDITSSTTPVRASTNYIMPSSGSVSLRLISVASNEPSISIDDCYNGPAEGYNVSSVSQATLIGSAYFATTLNCIFTRTSTTLGAFSDTDCPGPTVEFNAGPGTIQTTDANAPTVTVNNLPPGNYEVVFYGSAYLSTSAQLSSLAVNDGTTTSGQMAGPEALTGGSFTVVGYFNYSTTGNRSFQLYGSSAANAFNVPSDTSNRRLSFSIKRFPSSSEQAYTPDIVAWKVDANISGADITLGTAAQTAYVTPNNASLTLTQNSGSASVGISCSSTNDNSVGSTTCAAGSEEPGVVFNLPRSGTVQACFSFAHQIVTAATGVVNTTFQVVQTANGSQTVAIEGKARVQSGINTASTTVTFPHRVCGELALNQGKNTVRLMYEQAVTATVTSSNIFADAGANNGQRDVHVTVQYIDQSVPSPVLANMVTTSSSGGVKICNGYISAASPSVTNSTCSATVANGTGSNKVVTFGAGTFSAAPNCTVSAVNAAAGYSLLCAISAATTSTTVTVLCGRPLTEVGSSIDFYFICVGAR